MAYNLPEHIGSARSRPPAGGATVARPGRVYRLLRGLNTVVFALALALVLADKLIPPIPILDNLSADSWPGGHRHLIVSDRTGDPGWHAAITQAVATWSQVGTSLRLTTVIQRGPCRQAPDTIEICEQQQSGFSKQEIPGRQGFVDPIVDSDHHFHSVDVVVCSDCPIDQSRRVVIATHEIGHAIGLPHNGSPFSVMYPSGSTFGPDPQDVQILRSKYPPTSR
jgi:hypothetical protein